MPPHIYIEKHVCPRNAMAISAHPYFSLTNVLCVDNHKLSVLGRTLPHLAKRLSDLKQNGKRHQFLAKFFIPSHLVCPVFFARVNFKNH